MKYSITIEADSIEELRENAAAFAGAESAPAETPGKKKTPAAGGKTKLTHDDCRNALMESTAAGDAKKNVLMDMGYSKLSDLTEADIPAYIAAIKAL